MEQSGRSDGVTKKAGARKASKKHEHPVLSGNAMATIMGKLSPIINEYIADKEKVPTPPTHRTDPRCTHTRPIE